MRFPVSSRYLAFVATLLSIGRAALAGINSFTASPTAFLPGQDVTLSWNVTAGDVIEISPGVGPVSGPTGSVTVLPEFQTIYSLTNSTSGTSAQVTVRPIGAATVRNRWSFNEASGTVVADSLGAQNGTIIGAGFSRNGAQVVLPGGPSSSAPYIDLPNNLLTPLSEVTLEGWMTINGSQTWSRVFDFGTSTAGEILNVGGNGTGLEYLFLSAQIGNDQTQKRLGFRDNGIEQAVGVTDPVVNGQQFHFAVVYDADGNNGQPQVRYYKNGALLGILNTTYTLGGLVNVNNWLGRSNWTADSNTQGAYNEFRIWNGALSQSGISDSTAAGPDALPQTVRIDSFTAFPGTTIYTGQSARLSYLLANPSGDPFTATIDQGVGPVTGESGYVTVTPAGTTTYTLTVTAGATTRTAQVTVEIIPGAPQAEDLSLTAKYQTATPVTLVASDYNTPAGSLTFVIVDPPLHGSLGGAGANRTYTPANGYSGPDFFTYKANDGSADSNVAIVRIEISPPPIAPAGIALDEAALYTDLANGSFAGLLQASDGNPDDTFTFMLVNGAGATHNAFFIISGNQLISTHDFSGDAGQTISLRLRVTDSAGNVFEQIITLPVQARPPHVKINEINYNPARNTQTTEFIELHNPTNAAVNVGNWRFANGVQFVIPPGTSIPAGGYLVIAEDPLVLGALYGITALGPWTGGLSSAGEEIELRDAGGITVDRVRYGVTASWPVPPNGDGPSLELIHPNLANNLGGNWRASTVTQAAVTYVASRDAAWRYRKGLSEASSPITAWRGESFVEDGTWLTGQTPVGLFKQNSNNPLVTSAETGVTLATQLTDMATFAGSTFSTAYRCVFFRKTFNVSVPIPRAVLLRVMHNDAAIVWINGVEVARFGFQPAAPTDPPFDTTAYYELGNDPWSEAVLLDAGALLHAGANTIAIQGFAKPPQPRPTGAGPTSQEDPANYNVFDFCVDAELRSAADILGTPGAQNSVFATVAAPAVRDVEHSPATPKPWEPIVVSARVSDLQGVGSVQLRYQLCAPGNYIPSTLPFTAAQLLANPAQPPTANPAFEDLANWTTIAMADDGSVPGDVPGDGVFTARLPAQPHRTLVRYRVVASDLGGTSVTVPAADDPRKNFAAYVYHRIPVYTAGSKSFAPSTLNTLPIYQWLTRASDYSALLAYNASEQFPNTIALNVLLARRYENFAGTLVVGDQVIDHARVRLRGGNSRYAAFGGPSNVGKRHMRFNFPKGTPLYAADERGRNYPGPWEAMLFNKMFGNKGAYDWGLPYEIGGKLWGQQGVPMPESHFVHWRVVQNANEADAAQGDFSGLFQALEFPEGKNFLDARNLAPGNFYKMSDWEQNGEMDQRYQAKGAVDYGEDFDNIRYNIHQTTSQSDIERYVHVPLWYRYNAVQEAMRHYDIFVEPTGRHRVKNLLWYFEPQAGNPLGRVWFMPYDWDASFGPTFNAGWDYVHNALYNHADIIDSPTWSLPKLDRTGMRIEHRNAIREFRDLIWYRDGSGRGPFDDIVDDAVASIAPFYAADMVRWPVTGALGHWPNGPFGKAQDMKDFAFTGWADRFGVDPAVSAGGRAAYLDLISDSLDAGQLPAKPTISYSGAANYPVDGLAFTSSAFSDPQGADTFAATQWRIGEITDPAAPEYDPTAERIYEATAVWESGTLTTFNASVTVPGTALRIGHAYRARVRHMDTSGRWSHWSAPVQFITGASNYIQVLKENLMVSELMYHPAAPDSGFAENDYEYVELVNISPSLTLDLTNVRFTKGVDFDFGGSAITSLAPRARVLIVKNAAAFTLRHGAGKPIAGEWDPLDNLSNTSEEVKLSFGAGAEIHSFTYADVAPWPAKADQGGYSLVLKNPSSRPDHKVPGNWRASFDFNGSPGTDDATSYDAWAAANAAADPLADNDGDGLSNLLEYSLGGSNSANDHSRVPTGVVQNVVVNGIPGNYLTLTFRRSLRAEDLTYTAQFSPDLADWSVAGVLVTSTDNGDATVTEVWRASQPTTAAKYFARLRVLRP